MRPKSGFQHYITKAFTWRWNLLALGGALVAALISPVPDVVLPLVIAAEVTYLGALSGNPKFQKAIAAQEHAAKPSKNTVTPETRARVDKVLEVLDFPRSFRFKNLCKRCAEMVRLAARIRGDAGDASANSLHTSALDRMLWVFLRLLSSQQALERFLESTNEASMRQRVAELTQQLERSKEEASEKIQRSLMDSLATAKLRLNNLEKARDNAQFVALELDRIEDKIQALVEMSLGHEDPDFISSQVSSVAASMSDTEAVMRDMSFIPGVEELEEGTPTILETT